jgi:hypothetical protein
MDCVIGPAWCITDCLTGLLQARSPSVRVRVSMETTAVSAGEVGSYQAGRPGSRGARHEDTTARGLTA